MHKPFRRIVSGVLISGIVVESAGGHAKPHTEFGIDPDPALNSRIIRSVVTSTMTGTAPMLWGWRTRS